MTDGDGEVEVEGKINRLIKRKFQLYWGGGGGGEEKTSRVFGER